MRKLNRIGWISSVFMIAGRLSEQQSADMSGKNNFPPTSQYGRRNIADGS